MPSSGSGEGEMAEEGVLEGKAAEGSQSVVSQTETNQTHPARRFLLPSILSWRTKEVALQSSRAQSDPNFQVDTGSRFSVPGAQPEHFDVCPLSPV